MSAVEPAGPPPGADHEPAIPGWRAAELDVYRGLSALERLARGAARDYDALVAERATLVREVEQERQETGRLRARVEELEALTALPKVEIRRIDDERFDVLVNGQTVASANHDEHGWSGMDAVEATATKLARAFGADVTEFWASDEDRGDHE